MLQTIKAGALTLAALFILTAANDARAQERKLQQIGAWTIIANYDKGAFNRCIAEMRGPNGVLRVAIMANGVWSVSFPGFGGNRPQVGIARLNRLEAKSVLFTDHGARASAPLSPRWIEEFRRGGSLSIIVGRRSFGWAMANTGPAFGAVQDCVGKQRGPAAVKPPPRRFGFAQPHAHGYAPPPPPPAVIPVPAADPLATLKYVYANLDKPRSEPFSRRLAALRAAAERRSDQIKEPVIGLDFDYAINGQDMEPGTPASVRFRILGEDARRTSVLVSFRNGAPVELRYDLVLENGQWLIDDVWQIGGDAWALSDLLRQGAATP